MGGGPYQPCVPGRRTARRSGVFIASRVYGARGLLVRREKIPDSHACDKRGFRERKWRGRVCNFNRKDSTLTPRHRIDRHRNAQSLGAFGPVFAGEGLGEEVALGGHVAAVARRFHGGFPLLGSTSPRPTHTRAASSACWRSLRPRISFATSRRYRSSLESCMAPTMRSSLAFEPLSSSNRPSRACKPRTLAISLPR